MITTTDLRRKFLEFFQSKGHTVIPSASLIPENDPTVLFTTAGMHPLTPYILGEPHPSGKRIVNYQRCLRTVDIDEVGDNWHLTFFEMLGNWSLGDYWKQDSIRWSWEFLTDKKWLGLNPNRLAVTCFAGDPDAPRDLESAEAWRARGLPKSRIYFLGKEDNWWGPAGTTGPCGPDTEIFYDTEVSERNHTVSGCGPACRCGRWVEIWNNVFMEYEKTATGSFVKLHQQNVDTGMGLERTVAVLNGLGSVYEIDVFHPLLAEIRLQVPHLDERGQKITADHIRASVMMVMDGVTPSNKDRGYILRRLMRRVMTQDDALRHDAVLKSLIDRVIETYQEVYPQLKDRQSTIYEVLLQEKDKFAETFNRGLRKFEELAERGSLSGKDVFDLYTSFGFPVDAVRELARSADAEIDIAGFEDEFKRHQEISRQGAEQKFKGGLADHTVQTTRLHTATHMLQAALRAVLGSHVAQKGSNITAERLRFDFSHPDKLTQDQIKAVEDMVNEKIREDLPVEKETVEWTEGLKRGAIGVLGGHPGDMVTIYRISGFSVEFCGGPHVGRTGELGHFKIQKEEAVAAGIRRIKAVLE